MTAMGKLGVKTALIVLICALLSSCWDEVNVQDLSYITASGVDYDAKSSVYTVYAHIVDVAKVAKQGDGGEESKNKSYVGHAEGKTPYLAIHRLFETMQLESNIDHMMTLVVSEAALPHMNDLLDGINRNRAVRYTVRLLATSDSITSLFQMSEQVGKSPMNTDIYQPDANTKNPPFAKDWDLQKTVRSLNRPTSVTFIPKVDTESGHWEAERKLEKEPSFNGAYVLAGSQYKGKFSDEELAGVRWFRGNPRNMELPIKQRNQVVGAAHVRKSKHRIRLAGTSDSRPSYRLSLTVNLSLDELLAGMSEEEVEQAAEAAILKQIGSTSAIARSRGIDLFGLDDYTYRHHHRLWRRLKDEGASFAKLEMHTDVKVHLTYSGKMKLETS